MRWFSVISVRDGFASAVDEACRELKERLRGRSPGLVIAFVSPRPAAELRSLTAAISEEFPEALLFGCTGAGIIGDGTEVEDGLAVSLTAAVLPDVAVHPFALMMGDMPERDEVDGWRRMVGVDPDRDPGFLLLADPMSVDPVRLTRGLDEAYPGTAKVGGLASGGATSGSHALFLGGEVHHAGMVGVALTGDIAVEPVVAQGCKPVGEVFRITKGGAQFVRALDGRPVTDVLQETWEGLSASEQVLFRRSVFLGIAADSEREPRPGDFLVRNVLTVDALSGVMVVGAAVREGQRVQFHVRDAATSAADLASVLSRYTERMEAEPPAGALMFSCLGRGTHLYGKPGHDSEVFRKHLGDVPLGGFFCNGEIGPVHGRTRLHGYTSSFGLFRPRRWN